MHTDEYPCPTCTRHWIFGAGTNAVACQSFSNEIPSPRAPRYRGQSAIAVFASGRAVAASSPRPSAGKHSAIAPLRNPIMNFITGPYFTFRFTGILSLRFFQKPGCGGVRWLGILSCRGALEVEDGDFGADVEAHLEEVAEAAVDIHLAAAGELVGAGDIIPVGDRQQRGREERGLALAAMGVAC